jgi:hypothetical protein
MMKIDFNHPSFKGFEEGEDVLIDSGILLAMQMSMILGIIQ